MRGCQNIQGGETPDQATVDDDQMIVLQPGDTIDVTFLYAPELNQTQTVRADGKISLPSSMGEIEAAGKTPSELNKELVDLYSKVIQKPDLSVIVRSQKNRFVYVSGEVISPQPVELTSRLTALEAIMRAGGFKSETAMTKKVVVIRHSGGERHRYVLDLQGVISGMGMQKPFYLRPGDSIIVPSKVN